MDVPNQEINYRSLFDGINSVYNQNQSDPKKRTGKFIDYDKFVNLYTNTIKPVYNYLLNQGYTSQQASGILGNILQESAFDQSQRGGLTQLRGAHLKNYNSIYPTANWKNHLDYINNWRNGKLLQNKEVNYNYRNKNYNSADHSTAANSAEAFYKYWEAPGPEDKTLKLRREWADLMYDHFNSIKKHEEGGELSSDLTNITIGDKQYKVKIANTEELRYQGLRNKTELKEDEGMLFIWDSPQLVQMTMENTIIPLDQIFINEDYEVIKVSHRSDTKDDTLIGKNNVLMVLEVNINSGIKNGDELDIESEDDEKLPTMKVLAPDGSVQMELEGGERIFSRKNTKVLIRQAKKAFNSKSDTDYKRLGKSIFKFLNIQNNNEPEYVESPE